MPLKVWNGFFNHRDIHKCTWEHQTRNLKAIIDYIITKQNLSLKIQDVRVFRWPNCGTDHKLYFAIGIPCKTTTKIKKRRFNSKRGKI